MDLEQHTKKTGFTLGWQGSDSVPVKSQDGFSQMRPWQIDAFEQLKEAPFMILNAPMGSGKSWMMCLLSAFKMQNDNMLRTIIAVPQTIISSGFAEAHLQMPDGQKLHWQIKNNLCKDEAGSQGTVARAISWLGRSPQDFSDRVMLCTHATLLHVYRKLKSENRLYLLNNTLLWIDEAHHIKNIKAEGFEEAVINNGIGELVAFLLNQNDMHVQVGLTTASFFRGDRASLLTDDMEKKFKRFNLPYDVYLKSMKHLKSFSFDFVLGGHNSYIKSIELLAKDSTRKDIVYIPHPVSQNSTGDKHQEVADIMSTYGTVLGINEHGVTIVSREADELKVLDLVSEDRRNDKKEFLNNPVLKERVDALDVIIALNMFKEGANWIYADRCIIAGARSSLVDVVQMVGRLFRDAPGKNHVEVIQILPFSLDQQDKEKFRENLNDYLKAVYASLILENILNPVKIKSMQKAEKDNEASEKEGDSVKQNWLSMVLPDDARQQALLEEVNDRLVAIVGENKEAINDTRVLYDEYSKIMPEILEGYGVAEHKQEVAKQVWGTLVRRSMQMQGISVENIDFNIIQETHPLEFLLRYTSNVCDINTFEKLREAIAQSRNFRPLPEARDFVKELGLKSETGWRSYIAGDMPHLPPLPKDIPKAPWVAYKDLGWQNWGDFLGTGMIAPRLRPYRSYESASDFAKNLNLSRKDEWALYVTGKMPWLPALPTDIPSDPRKVYSRVEYGQAWVSWGIFLGTNRISNQAKSKKWKPYNDTCGFAQRLNLKTAKDWREYVSGRLPNLPELPDDMPKKPDEVYEEWIDWTTFLGNKEVSKFNSQRTFLTFEQAREFVHKLGLNNLKDWQDYCAGKIENLAEKPLEIPSNPSKKYKNSGWVNLQDWLGTTK